MVVRPATKSYAYTKPARRNPPRFWRSQKPLMRNMAHDVDERLPRKPVGVAAAKPVSYLLSDCLLRFGAIRTPAPIRYPGAQARRVVVNPVRIVYLPPARNRESISRSISSVPNRWVCRNEAMVQNVCALKRQEQGNHQHCENESSSCDAGHRSEIHSGEPPENWITQVRWVISNADRI